MYNGTIKIKEVSLPIPIAVKIRAFTYTDKLPVTENTRNIMANCQFESIPHFALSLFMYYNLIRKISRINIPQTN
jgi:hypothetical protein